jgi:hypothetical protein
MDHTLTSVELRTHPSFRSIKEVLWPDIDTGGARLVGAAARVRRLGASVIHGGAPHVLSAPAAEVANDIIDRPSD